MTKHGTKTSRYLLDQEHITDREIDEVYNAVKELLLNLDEFKEKDVKYRALENVNTKESETDRIAILDASALILGNITNILKQIEQLNGRIYDLFIRAKGALEEKLEAER